MSSTDGGGKSTGPATTIIVKGGTTSSRFDRDLGRQRFEADRRRAASDKMYQDHAKARSQGDMVRMGSHDLMRPMSPRIVLHYMRGSARNMTGGILWQEHIHQDAVCELMEDSEMPPADRERWKATHNEEPMMFIMVCPKCVARGIPMGLAQMKVRQAHRYFVLHRNKDTRQGFPGSGDIEIVQYGWGNTDTVLVAGTVSTEGVIRCDNVNCDFAARIDHSRVFHE